VACEISEKLPNMQVVREVRATVFCAGADGGGGREFHRVRSSGIARFSL
jgi:hypothetical protein